MTRIIVGKNGRIVIPKNIRQQLEIETGSVLETFIAAGAKANEKTLMLTKIA